MQSLIIKSRDQINSFTSIWYPPDNTALERFLYTELPWKAQGHKTYEFTFTREETNVKIDSPENILIIPFSDKYLEATCAMFDSSLSHTFDDPNASPFFNNKEHHLRDWNEKAQNGDCCVMLENKELVGAYVLKDSEIDLIAISTEKQGKGLGSVLLNNAKEHKVICPNCNKSFQLKWYQKIVHIVRIGDKKLLRCPHCKKYGMCQIQWD